MLWGEKSLDVFWREHSNLKKLLKFPIDHSTLDCCFEHELPNQMAIYLSHIILNIVQELDVQPVAEGVETESQLSLLTEIGYRVVQGFFYSLSLFPIEFEL
ncbi:EAL domain-containing protein [Marinomonas posidonica]|uniref:EAL domain-containing protein n=1 Tax=Marinomonas posidonica TaxID=936476 RepID=UPI000A06B6B0|nr:EAL domain-containing protein [Marinomonas posidonica]